MNNTLNATREKAIDAALELARRTGTAHTADDIVREARKIEAYLDGTDTAKAAAPSLRNDDTFSINRGFAGSN